MFLFILHVHDVLSAGASMTYILFSIIFAYRAPAVIVLPSKCDTVTLELILRLI